MTQHTTFTPSSDLLPAACSRSGCEKGVDRPPQTTLSVIATVTNLRQMAQAYGDAFAAHALRILHERANALGFVDTCTVMRTGEHLLFSFDLRAHAQRLLPSGVDPGPYLIDRILLSLGNEAVKAGDAHAYPAIVAEVVPSGTRPEAIIEKSVSLQFGQPFTQWRRQYQANTTTARRVFGALASGRLDFDFEPVYDLRTGGEPLYYEALLCERTDGQLRHIGASVAAIEQLGLARRLDHWVVRAIIARLRALPGVRLGCNISMQSAVPDAWWALAFATLEGAPELASRLTIEITETALSAQPEAVIGFVRKLQSFGCQVALDDIGTGFSCLQQLTSLDADVAKIDRSFLVAAREDDMAALRLGQLVGFARTCTNSVIIEGIESDEDARLACASGATGLQGHLFRSGAYGPDVARLLQLPGSHAARNG